MRFYLAIASIAWVTIALIHAIASLLTPHRVFLAERCRIGAERLRRFADMPRRDQVSASVGHVVGFVLMIIVYGFVLSVLIDVAVAG